jgi:hypothetical protein
MDANGGRKSKKKTEKIFMKVRMVITSQERGLISLTV